LKENGFHPERDWPLREGDQTYQVDLALPMAQADWLPIVFASVDENSPPGSLRFHPDQNLADCVKLIKRALQR
jgi:hypothetical protein